MDEPPNFAAWSRGTLDEFALEAYLRIQEQTQTMEHMRMDLHDAMTLLRGAMREVPRRTD